MESSTTEEAQNTSASLQATEPFIDEKAEDKLIGRSSSNANDTIEIGSNVSLEPDSTGVSIERDLPSISIYHQVPKSHNDSIFRSNFEHRYASLIVQTVRDCAQQLKKPENSKQQAKHKCEEKYEIAAILESLCVLQKVTSKFCQATKLAKVLETIMDPKRQFSVFAVQTAQKLHQKFEKQHWGESADLRAPPVAHPAGVGNLSVNNNSSGTGRRVRESSAASAPVSPNTISTVLNTSTKSLRPDVIEILQFDHDHPVFGDRGVMRGIKVHINKTKNTKSSYFLDKTQEHKRADVIGHNGHSVGDCWAFQICLVRDGVHGSSQGGIYGNKASGAYSIIVHGESAYAAMDDDVGDTLFYSGAGSVENTDADTPKDTEGTQALQTSAEKKQSIRVIRGQNRKKVGAPQVGYRYDGLYQVVGQTQRTNDKGGAYTRFELERESDQPARDKSRPNTDELREFRAIRRAIEQKLK